MGEWANRMIAVIVQGKYYVLRERVVESSISRASTPGQSHAGRMYNACQHETSLAKENYNQCDAENHEAADASGNGDTRSRRQAKKGPRFSVGPPGTWTSDSVPLPNQGLTMGHLAPTSYCARGLLLGGSKTMVMGQRNNGYGSPS